MRAVLTDIYADHCAKPNEARDTTRDRFEKALERDYFMTAEEAMDFGLVDEILQKRL